MGLPAYLYTNLLDDNATITPSAEDSVYPASGLYDSILAWPSKLTTSGGTWSIDLGSAKSFDTIAIGNHNFVATAVVQIKAGLTPSPTSVIATPAWREKGIVSFLSTQSARYIDIVVTETNPESTSIGELAIGTRIAFPISWRWGGRPLGEEQKTLGARTDRGVLKAHQQYALESRDYIFRIVGDTDIAIFRTLHETVLGSIRPFWLFPNVAGTEVFFGRKEDGFNPVEITDAYDETAAGGKVVDYILKFTEDSNGLFVLE